MTQVDYQSMANDHAVLAALHVSRQVIGIFVTLETLAFPPKKEMVRKLEISEPLKSFKVPSFDQITTKIVAHCI
jgi:hypothetical protein